MTKSWVGSDEPQPAPTPSTTEPQGQGSQPTPWLPPQPPSPQPAGPNLGATILGGLSSLVLGTTGPRGGHHEGLGEAMLKSAARSTGTQLSRQLVRGVLGSLLGGSRR